MNRVFLIGNLTKDPELSETNSGISVCHFSIAVNRGFASGEDRQTDFFNVTCWRGTAENVAKFTRKGSKVAVMGSVQMRSYEDKNGIQRTAVDIVAQEVEFLNSRSSQSGEYDSAPAPSAAKKKPVLEAFDDDSEIPF